MVGEQTKKLKETISFYTTRTSGRTRNNISRRNRSIFGDFFLELTPAEFKFFGTAYAYNKDKMKHISGDGGSALTYKFYAKAKLSNNKKDN